MPVIVPSTAAVAAIAASNADSATDAGMAAQQPATAYVVCHQPRHDHCFIHHTFGDDEKLSFQAFAERLLGYPVVIAGIAYNSHDDDLVIYVNKLK